MGIKQTLLQVDAIREERIELYSEQTRDFKVPVYKDSVSGVIFIDNFYVGDEEYVAGDYRGDSFAPNLENELDTARRVATQRSFYVGKTIMDWGCGKGDFLRSTKAFTTNSIGIELQDDYRERLQADGIEAKPSTNSIADSSIDSCFMFHVLEHLEDPLAHLAEIKRTLVPGGNLIIEIPHAKDFLLTMLKIEEFKAFTLWSQHLVLHTRESVSKLLDYAGFKVHTIQGIQRYGLSNHLNWAVNRLPGGHLSNLSVIEDENLRRSYEASLAKIDVTDTILVHATVQIK